MTLVLRRGAMTVSVPRLSSFELRSCWKFAFFGKSRAPRIALNSVVAYKSHIVNNGCVVAARNTETDLTLQEYKVFEHRNKRRRGIELAILLGIFFLFRYVLMLK